METSLCVDLTASSSKSRQEMSLLSIEGTGPVSCSYTQVTVPLGQRDAEPRGLNTSMFHGSLLPAITHLSAHHFLLDIDHGRILYLVLLVPFSHILALYGLRIKFPRLSSFLSPKPLLPLSCIEHLSLDGVRPNLSCPQGQVPWAFPLHTHVLFQVLLPSIWDDFLFPSLSSHPSKFFGN